MDARDARQNLRIPRGTEGFSLHDAYRHREVVRLAEETFISWGYLPAQLPVFDYFDSYRSLIDDSTLGSVYRLVDRDGELLMLRSDMTLFLAKHLGAHTGRAEGPVRVSYGDSILRYQDSEDISHNEFYQLGAELIGVADTRGDIEVVALLGELIASLSLDATVINVGSRALFGAATARLAPEEKSLAAEALLVRDFDGFASLTGVAPAPFTFIGSRSEFAPLHRELEATLPGAPTRDAIAELETLVSALDSIEPPFEVRIDLSEIGTQSYYTGCVFGVYLDGVATAIASGGRYDELLAHFGDPRPAVGFSLMPRKFEQLLALTERFAPPPAIRVTEADFARALHEARAIRRAGGAAIL